MRSARLLLLAALVATAMAGPFNASDWTLPANFEIQPYGHTALPAARMLAVSGNSKVNGPTIVWVSSQSFGPTLMPITAMVDLNGKGAFDYAHVVIPGLSTMPNGIAWFGGALYIASLEKYQNCRLYKLPNADSFALEKRVATLADLVLLRDDLPIDFWHGWKPARFGPDGKLYVPIGANCNICRLDGSPPNNGYDAAGNLLYNTTASGDPYHVTAPYQKTPASPVFEFGSIYRFNADGSNPELVAKGVRNSVGLDFHPATKKLYFTDNGRDNMGGSNATYTENHPDCELNFVSSTGQDFGFPYCHTGPAGNNADARPYNRLPGVGLDYPDPNLNANESVRKCNGVGATSVKAIQAIGPHTAPLGMRFYKWSTGANFPSSFNNSIFVALHGSWNRGRPIGARVMRVTLSATNPGLVSTYTSFLAGGVPGDKGEITGPVPPVQPATAYNGRPVDVEQLPDGSLLVSDDSAGTVYRVSYRAPLTCRTGGGGNFASTGAAIPNTANGCIVNLGGYGQRSYKKCVQWDTTEKKHWVQLAYNVYRAGTQVVLDAAMVVPRHMCTNRGGWMAAGLPKAVGEDGMLGSNVVFAFPTPGTARGAAAVDYRLAGWTTSSFTPSSPGFLARPPAAYVSAGALVSTFSINLPSVFAGASPPSLLKMVLALGDINGTTGAFLKHWVAHATQVPFTKANIGAAVPTSGLLVLNPGLGPAGPTNGVAPPPPSPPPAPETPAPPCTAANGQCCLDGMQFDACATSTGAGLPITHFYRTSGGRLHVGILGAGAATSNWLAWSYNPDWQGHMVGADAYFVRPCASCATKSSPVAFNMPSTSVGSFVPPRLVNFSGRTSGVVGSDLFATFSLPVATNATLKVNVGTGPYSGADPASAAGMQLHTAIPPTACVRVVNGAPTVTFTGC